MPTLQQLFEFSSLSQSSYALIKDIDDAAVRQAVRDLDVLAPDQFGTEQANKLIGPIGFSVLHHQPNDAVGFSATLFTDNRTPGQLALAIRGTEGSPLGLIVPFGADPDRFDANADIINPLRGIARNQLVSLYNYFRRLIAPTNVEVPFYRLVDSDTAPATGAFYAYLRPRPLLMPEVRYVCLQFDHVEFGLGQGAALLNLTGHSLGGHLAMALSRLFPNQINRVVTYNAPGFQEGTSLEINSLFELLARNEGIPIANVADFPQDKISNLFAYNGPEIVTNTTVFRQPGKRIGVFIEDQAPTLTGNHSISQLSDSLSLYQLFSQIRPILGVMNEGEAIAAISRILESIANRPESSLELALDSLRKLFKDPNNLSFASTPVGNRNQFYQNLYDPAFQERMASYAGQLSISRLTDISSTDLSNLASGSSAFAFRYALRELNPFAVVGNNTLYDRHNRAGELNLYDAAATMRAGMTTQYIADRAQMLVFANTANTNDVNAFGSNQIVDQVRYTDLGKVAVGKGGDFVVFLPGGVANSNGPNTRRMTFGTDSTDSLVGRNNTDHLYGGGGTDVLSGNGGDDYLEGGSGLDVYNYNASPSSGNDGQDIVLDTDGRGVLRYVFRDGVIANAQNTVVAEASVRVSGVQWQSADAQFRYTRSGEDLVVTETNGDGARFLCW